MEKDYSALFIKSYRYWEVSLYENQGYLGRCVVWCKREDALDMADMRSDEQEELFFVLRELKRASTEAFRPDWFNYAFLGNEVRHLHAHFIPRYAKPKDFAGMIFKDELYGHNYRTDRDFTVPAPIFSKILEELKNALH